MAFTPEPTYPFNEVTLPAQLNRVFWDLFNNDQELKDYIIGALPIKAFNVILDGAGTGDPNPTLPTIRPVGVYNIDDTFGVGGITHPGLGRYGFKMRFSLLSDVPILLATFPVFTFSVDFPANALTRTGPTRTSFDDSWSLTVIDGVTGEFEVETEHIFSTGGGALSVEPADMQAGDVLLAMGLMSATGNAGDYSGTP